MYRRIIVTDASQPTATATGLRLQQRLEFLGGFRGLNVLIAFILL
jgi:hypothetical protein